MEDNSYFLSVIVPTHNSRDYLSRSLAAIRGCQYPFLELIVVDDASHDDSTEIASRWADHIIQLKDNAGPARARNSGALKSKGDVLLFIDADVEVAKDTLFNVSSYLRDNPAVTALFGSYDVSPPEKNFFSQYKNLHHHFVHQHARTRALTFWSGCGAIRKDFFIKAGGFPEEHHHASIEDVALGYKITSSGGRIDLVKDIQVKHLKKWTFSSLIKTDILHRAIPWTKLSFQRTLPYDLNFKFPDRLSALLVLFLVMGLIFSLRWKILLPSLIILSLTLFFINIKLYRFFYQKKDIFFALRSILFHWFYLFYSLVTFGLTWICLLWKNHCVSA